ncbi:hypothetical protein Plec18167_001445 [Paecilomyces lecythidis]|uniref:D-lactate dehydrogenase n=1 Tax=Paecilomyces lecythidis TaxID=3004212 RepID=A0ABR3YCW6_9EURO
MKLAVFSAKSYDREYFQSVQRSLYPSYQIEYHSFALSEETVPLASDCQAVCVFVNDVLDAKVLSALRTYGVGAVLLRCAGFDNVDLQKAEELGLFVARVPAYSPESVAEFAVALIQALNRKTHRAYTRVREGNFSLDGFTGFTLHGKTVGIVGIGKIGMALAKILKGFGCHLLAYDPYPNEEFEQYGRLVPFDELLAQSHIVSLHCPLSKATKYIINDQSLAKIKKGALLINTSRGGLVDTKAAITALKSRKLGGLALDVYEAESYLFYTDHSSEIIQDDDLMRLLTLPNALMCGHQAFLTEEALTQIAEITFRNLEDYAKQRKCENSLVQGRDILVSGDTQPVRI